MKKKRDVGVAQLRLITSESNYYRARSERFRGAPRNRAYTSQLILQFYYCCIPEWKLSLKAYLLFHLLEWPLGTATRPSLFSQTLKLLPRFSGFVRLSGARKIWPLKLLLRPFQSCTVCPPRPVSSNCSFCNQFYQGFRLRPWEDSVQARI